MPTISIRITEDEFKRLEAKCGSRTKSDFYREIVFDYLNTLEDGMSSLELIRSLRSENNQLKAVVQVKDEYTKSLQTQLGWMQTQYAKFDSQIALLLPDPTKKPWWQFWKK